MGVARRRPLPPLLLLPLLLAPPAILLCGGSRAAAVEVGTFGPWTGCVLSADVLGGNDTVFEVSGVIQFAGMDPPPTLVRVGDDAPFLSGSVRVGLEFGGKEARPGADCSALLAEESEPVTGLRLLPPSEPLSTVPDPIVVWVSAGPLDNLAKVTPELPVTVRPHTLDCVCYCRSASSTPCLSRGGFSPGFSLLAVNLHAAGLIR